MKKIVFRADGNQQSGLGHLYRIFALVEMYQNDYSCTLVTREDSLLEVIPKKFTVRVIPGFDILKSEAEWLATHFLPEEHTIIADGYHFDAGYQKAIKNAGFRLFYIDDLTTTHMYADVVINHSLAVSPSDFIKESYTKLALGTAYALLRTPFLKAAAEQRIAKQIKSVFVCFGGADINAFSGKAVKALLRFSQISRIIVVVGAAYSDKTIYELAEKYRYIEIHKNLNADDLLALMRECDFAICPTSNILYEVCAVKMPVLAGYYVENQKNLYSGCLQNELIYDAGDFTLLGDEQLNSLIKHVLEDKDHQRFLQNQARMFDSHIKDRFYMLMNNISFRPAAPGDMEQIFMWANDDVARKNSYQQEKISLEQHQKWFTNKLNDPNAFIFIFSVEDKPAGMVRFDVIEDRAVVGILVGTEFRGRGLASTFLKEAAHELSRSRKADIVAYIKDENEASIKAFKTAGYLEVGKDVVHGAKSKILMLSKNDL